MCLFRQYPDVLVATLAAEGHRDSEGNWVTGLAQQLTIGGNSLVINGVLLSIGSGGETLTEKCRAEPNTSGRMVVGVDGTQVYYSWIVYTPHSVDDIPFGIEVSISRDGEVIASGTVKRFHRGLLNARIWL